ncbi:membrane dipeptidase [Roseomonas sp. NAR14]|uniref:Membrane dipeptidase n=1 Tax=Roseomonas acroporae TaxID=2937791 RepID=A0A9X1YIW6_9PROT|nr:membrane dipeptidase [Roseomonas acroporae]
MTGWPCCFEPGAAHDYLALLSEPSCCLGCLPRDPARRIEVIATAPVLASGGPLRLRGTWRVLEEAEAGWRYRLEAAWPVAGPADRPVGAVPPRLGRRAALSAGPLLCLAACTPAASAADEAAARQALADSATVDIHSHAGHVIGTQRVAGQAPFLPVAEPMRAGGMAAICLAIVSDSPVHRVMADRRIRPFRDPAPGELRAYGEASFARLHALLREQELAVITDAAALRAARSGRPSVVVSAEGADFLEGDPAGVEAARNRWALRHLQLTHYRVNELGDIQTEPPVHGGLTPVGAEVIRRCNRLGVVVDVAHGTYDLVKQAAAVTTRPLVLSHTSLADAPGRFSRLVSPDHARVVAGTGGVIGIWPPASRFPDMAALAAGFAAMVEVVGVEHVGLGTDMRGLTGPAVFDSYRDLPALAAALLARGFSAAELRALLGGNYTRVFAASLGG